MLESLDPLLREESGRYTILSRLLRMSKGHVVFIPNTSQADDVHSGFVVAKVDGDYYFENRLRKQAGTWAKDFAHCRPVTDVHAFPYVPSTLTRQHFQAYRTAVNMAEPTHDAFSPILTFLQSQGIR